MRRMGLYLFGKAFMGFVGLSGDHDSRRIFIQSMNDARADDAIDAGQFPLTVVEQGIDQGPVIVSGCRMNDHPARLIDDDDILIFINDIERNIFGLNVIFFLHV